MKCIKCGNELTPGAKFCVRCGTPAISPAYPLPPGERAAGAPPQRTGPAGPGPQGRGPAAQRPQGTGPVGAGQNGNRPIQPGPTKKKSRLPAVIAALVIAAVLGVGGFFGVRWFLNRDSGSGRSAIHSTLKEQARSEKDKDDDDQTVGRVKEETEDDETEQASGEGQEAEEAQTAAAAAEEAQAQAESAASQKAEEAAADSATVRNEGKDGTAASSGDQTKTDLNGQPFGTGTALPDTQTPETKAPEAQTPAPAPQDPEGDAASGYIRTEKGIHRYQLVVADVTWNQAFNQAKEAGGYLVQINDQEEFDHILEQIRSSGLSNIQFLLGARRDREERTYYWADINNTLGGEILNSPDAWCSRVWLSGEPSFQDGDSVECYVDMFYVSGTGWIFNDVPDDILAIVPAYSGKIGYIIEFE